jgi:photosystem II stability/assembly factor-like uncharacterized protein
MAGVWITEDGSIRATARRGAVLTFAACLSVLAAACGSPAKVTGGVRATAPAGRPAASEATAAARLAASARAAARTEQVDLIDLAAARLGLVGLGTGGPAAGTARLVASADFGRSFTSIGPSTAAGTISDGVFFLNREDGWFPVYNVNTAAETLYRTRNGGHSWRASGAPGHVGAPGSHDTVQFITPAHGWLLDIEPTGPVESLFVTTDGGAHWRTVARARPGHGPGVLPGLGQIQFGPGGAGWLGGGPFSRALYRTGDGGRTWRRARIPAPSGSEFGLPAVFGRTLIEPVTTGRALTLYRSSDGGTRWRKVSVLPGATGGSCAAGQLSVSFPAPQSGWATAVLARRTVVYRTTDGGLHWAKAGISWPVPPNGCEPPVIQATDAGHAWLLTAGNRQVYATTTGGTAWYRIDTAAIAAAG